MRTVLIFIASLFFQNLFAQSSQFGRIQKSGERFRENAYQTALRQTIILSNGKAAAVGSIDSKTNGGSDGYLVLFNPMGQDVTDRNIGGTKDDGFNSIAQLPDGTLLAAGFTRSSESKKQMAWLVQVNDSGRVLRERTFDLAAFQSVLVGDDGTAYLLGTGRNDQQIELKCVKISDWKVIFDKNYSFGNSLKDIKSATLAQDGGVVLVGNTQKSGEVNSDDIWVIKVDKTGNMAFSKRYGEARYVEEAETIIRTADNGFAIAGNTNSNTGNNRDAWLLKLDETGTQQWQKTYGGKGVDVAFSVAQTFDERYYLVGKTFSHTNGARSSQIHLIKTNAAGERLWEDYDGGKADDWATALTPLYDGSFLLTAFTEGGDNNHAWYYRFNANDDDMQASFANDNPFRRADWQVQTDSRFLEANQNTALGVRFTNTAQRLIKNVQLKCKSQNPLILPQNLTFLGAFRAGETKNVMIPIKTLVGLEEGQHTLDIELTVGGATLEKFSYKVIAKRRNSQQIFLQVPPQYATDGNGITTVKVTIENPTATAAADVRLAVELPRGLQAVGEQVFNLAKPILAGKNAEVSFKYRGEILSDLGAERPKFNCLLFQNNVLTDAAKMEIAPLSKNSTVSSAMLVWTSPDEDKADIQNISLSKSAFDIELKAYTNEPVKREQFKIFVDELPIDGSKMDVVDLSAPVQQQNQFRQIYKTRLELEPQKRYRVRVDLQTTRGGIISSRTLMVRYNPDRPNLHVVSIGTSNSDLKYTAKDAANVASFFRKQTNLPFKKMHITERSDSSKTDYKNIKRVFNDLVKRYDNPDAEQRIEQKDYLVVFISSHGKTGDDKQYKILPSDYNPSDGDLLTIDYQSDVMNQLNKINCHKIVFIDACHSGLMRGSKSSHEADALLKISQAAVGTTILASCRADELSYEDESWQNGAFTKSLLEALSNQSCSDETGGFSSDVNKDGLVTLGEIVQFIKRRVPVLAAGQKRLTSQNPVLINGELDSEIPLILLNR